MNPSELRELRKLVEPYRNEEVLVDGMLLPKSASILLSVLDTETDPDKRYFVYAEIVSECRRADKTSAAVRFAQARYQEFNDVTSLMGYSMALVDNGEIAAAVSRAKEALNLAIEKHALVNYAAGNLVRQAIQTGSVETVNEAIDALIDSTQMPRDEDCALETDWTDAAEALGADKELISWVRMVAGRK